MLRALALALLALVAGFIGVTWVALESGGVGIVETRNPAGEVRRSHVWPARIGGELWLEAGTPQNGWYLDVRSSPELWLDYEGTRARYRAVPVREPSVHDRVRRAIRGQFGWRDQWVGIWVDSAESIAVRLEPVNWAQGVRGPPRPPPSRYRPNGAAW